MQSNLVYGVAAKAVSIAASVAADLTTAASLLPSPVASLGLAQSTTATAGGTTLGSSAYGQNVAAVTAAQTDLAGQVATTGAALPDFDLSLAGTEPTAAPASVTAITASAGQLASLTAAQSYLGRGLSTLTAIGS
ncbi:hypothetical protein [Acidisoma silvae]|uniref:Uncharacterized protein n=1 Tax=Acidisoma silvae TaxID=2802396 RepID=A0A964DY62_9PROT|nr:hypothetical protein [Acidisoma silvae]MCB8874772.1 hypothetical protein [Acidisoma silvae]